MRTRKEILENRAKIRHEENADVLVLEVLLDIRDLLEEERAERYGEYKILTPEDRQNEKRFKN